MTLTIPEAGTTAGRAAAITVPVPDTGAQLAGLGDAMLRIGTGMEAERLDRAMQRAELEITRDLGALRLEFEQMDDPDAIDSQWGPRSAALKESYLTRTDAQGRPVYDRKLADRIGLAFDDLAYRHAFALGQNAIGLRDSQRAATAFETIEEVKRQAAMADPEVLDALLARADAAAAALHPRDPAAAAEARAKNRADIFNARAIAAISADPAGFITAYDAGDFDGLDPERGASLRATAVAAEAAAAAAAAKAGEAAAKAARDQTDAAVKRAADGLFKGRNVRDMDLIANPTPEVLASPEYPRARAALDLFRETPDLAGKTVAELDALIAAEEGRPVGGEAWENERLGVLRAMRDALVTAQAADPKAAAIDRGVIAPQLGLAFDPANPGAFAAGLAEAVSLDAHLRETGHTDRSAILTARERADLKAVLAPGAETGPKLALAMAILDGTGGSPAAVLGEIEADPVFRRTVKVLALTGDSALAESMLRGQAKIDGKTVVLPSRREMVLAFDALTGGVFDDAPAIKSELIEAMAATYADSASGIDGETTASDGLPLIADNTAYDLMQRSLQRVLGAQPDRNGDLTMGGVQEVNGALTVLPPDVTVAAVDDLFDALNRRLAGAVWDTSRGDGQWVYAPSRPEDFPEAILKTAPSMDARMAPFRAASLYGGVPDLGPDPAKWIDTLQLRRVGEQDDLYELVYEMDGQFFVVPQQGDGRAYRFRLRDLIRGARQ